MMEPAFHPHVRGALFFVFIFYFSKPRQLSSQLLLGSLGQVDVDVKGESTWCLAELFINPSCGNGDSRSCLLRLAFAG